MYNFLCQIVLNIFKYILFTKRIETFWSRDVINIRELAHSEFKTHKDFMYLTVLNIFKYMFCNKCPKKIRQDIWTISSVKMTRYSQRSKVLKCSNTLKLYTLKALLSKNRFYFFFVIF